MCKIIIHVANTGDHEDEEQNEKRFLPGDVVDIVEDNHVFGRLDLGSHNRVISLPNIRKKEIIHLIGSDPSQSPVSMHMARARIWNIPHYQYLMPVVESNAVEFLKSCKLKPLKYKDV